MLWLASRLPTKFGQAHQTTGQDTSALQICLRPGFNFRMEIIQSGNPQTSRVQESELLSLCRSSAFLKLKSGHVGIIGPSDGPQVAEDMDLLQTAVFPEHWVNTAVCVLISYSHKGAGVSDAVLIYQALFHFFRLQPAPSPSTVPMLSVMSVEVL